MVDCEQSLYLGESREVRGVPHAKGDACARGGKSLRRSLARFFRGSLVKLITEPAIFGQLLELSKTIGTSYMIPIVYRDRL